MHETMFQEFQDVLDSHSEMLFDWESEVQEDKVFQDYHHIFAITNCSKLKL